MCELNATIATAQRILAALVAKGQAVSTASPDEFAVTIYVFPELKVGTPIPVTPAEWEAYHLPQKEEEMAQAEEEGPKPGLPKEDDLMDRQ